MYWTGAKGVRFIRPIRWIVALLDGKVVPVSFADVQSGNHTEGHRFLGKKAIPVTGPADYEAKLKREFCALPRRKRGARRSRRNFVRSSFAQRICARTKMRACSMSVTYLNEYPIGDHGRISIRAIPRSSGGNPDYGDARPSEIFCGGEPRRRACPAFSGGDQSAGGPKGFMRAGMNA